jgi:hypothetical protein
MSLHPNRVLPPVESRFSASGTLVCTGKAPRDCWRLGYHQAGLARQPAHRVQRRLAPEASRRLEGLQASAPSFDDTNDTPKACKGDRCRPGVTA